MPVKYTPEQQQAINLHNRNILVSAAAGSGKTAVLVERIVRMVCDEENPVDIDRLLVVTFTKAAAAEMRERLADGIAKRLGERPESAHIQRQATLLHNAQITTIDSFCLFLLRNHFNEIGLDPAFRIIDEGEVRLMQQEVLKELLEDCHASGDEAFRYCVEYFCPGGRESALEQHILSLSRYAASFPWPAAWLAKRREDYAAAAVEELCAGPCALWLLEYLRRMTAGCAEKLARVKALCEEPDGPYMYGELVDRELEQLESLLACESLEDYAVRLPAVGFGRLPAKKDDSVSPAKRELAKAMRAEVKESLGSLEGHFFATPLELAARQSAACRGPVCTLIDLALAFDERMREKKQERKGIDFSDMEHYALDILLDGEGEEARPSQVALEYRQHFVEILTDEYQDSNLVQEYLLKAVSGEEDGHFNRFMVGDVKQSIYKFRLARPELFLEKYNSYGSPGADEGPARETESCVRIDLSKNFRSRTQVVDAVNDVFSRLMSETVGGIPYDSRAALYPGAAYPENDACASELLLIEKPGKDSGLDEKEAEGLAIACRIKELRSSFSVTDKEDGGLRGARFSDMVILLRTPSGWDEALKEVLEREGIPAHITSRTGYFEALEVQELLQLLRVLDNPTQDIPLFGVMKSVFGGFTEEETARIRSCARNCCLYEALKRFAGSKEDSDDVLAEDIKCAFPGAPDCESLSDGKGSFSQQREDDSQTGRESGASGYPTIRMDETEYSMEGRKEMEGQEDTESRKEDDAATGESALQKKAASFLHIIEDYRRCTVYLPVRDLLTKLIGDFGYLEYVTALPGGSRRRANVEMLLTKASDFEKTSYFGLFHFIRYMEQLEKYDVDSGGAELLDENADVVRIMSIHKSKGLEFPITFVAGLNKRFNMQDAGQSLILDMDLGLGTDYVDPERRVRNRTLRRNILSGKLREESLSEELRLLYVAMTRAREKLIMSGTVEKAGEVWERAGEAGHDRLTYLDFMEAHSYLEFLMPVLPHTCIQVTVLEEVWGEGAKIGEQIQLHQKRGALERAEVFADAAAKERLEERLKAVYPYAMLAGLYTKTTVSELKIAAMADRDEAAYHTFEEKEVQPYIPMFRREEEKIGGAVRGSAYHKVMELLDFDRVLGDMENANVPDMGGKEAAHAMSERLHAFLCGEVEEKRLSEEFFQAVNERKIVNFLRSDIACRMWKAQREGRLYREQPFVLGIDARRLRGDFPDTETVLIQGIIDVFFEEEDGLVLLDYKTDAVSSMAELWNRYETQLDYYQEAVAKLYGRPVKERLLYSFHLETC